MADRLSHAALLGRGQEISKTEQVWRGRTISVQHRCLPDVGWVSTMEDVTEQKQTEARINHLAHFDALTGLPNRPSFLQRVGTLLQHAKQCSLLYIDLDRFKPVNDTFGHAVGDEVLKHISGRIKAVLRCSDVGARLGGDASACSSHR